MHLPSSSCVPGARWDQGWLGLAFTLATSLSLGVSSPLSWAGVPTPPALQNFLQNPETVGVWAEEGLADIGGWWPAPLGASGVQGKGPLLCGQWTPEVPRPLAASLSELVLSTSCLLRSFPTVLPHSPLS